jgi:hypothetical protein
MLDLKNHIVRVTSVSLNAENHGEDHRTGLTLGFKTAIEVSALDKFDPGLKTTLFREQKPGDQMDAINKNEGLTEVKFPKLAPFAWTEKFPGYEADIGVVGSQDPIQAIDVTLRELKFKALQGGSVELSGKLYWNPEEDEIGPLAKLMKEDAELTLIPPAKAAPQDE